MSRPKVFVSRVIPNDGLDLVRSGCEADVWPDGLPPSRGEVLKRVRGADGVLCMLSDPIDAEVMDAAGPGLKVISSYAVGFDNIDVAEATRRGILVTNTPGVLTEATADLAFALLMAAARRIPEGIDNVRKGLWKTWGPMTLRGHDVYGATLGIVGLGRIGSAMARRALGFDMDVLYFNRGVPRDDVLPKGVSRCETLNDLLDRSDFVSLHVPHTPDTHHLIDRNALDRMKRTAILINTARGAVVNTDALVEALSDGAIAGAALDVTDPEPLPAGHPLVLLGNCLVVPHIGSASYSTRARMAVMAAENLLAGLAGKRPANLVNPEVLS
ncbi:MAG: D-glycerate dehydrogenase [Deltaproteobacteria bacterium]|nr:D-glycerate dehydrogenase [Deltaproteobacteria bacterium]